MYLNLIINIISLFSLVFIGYLVTKIGVLKFEDKEAFSKYVLYIATPALILVGMTKNSVLSLNNAFIIILISIIFYFIMFFLSFGIDKFHKNESNNGLYRLAFIFSNTGFVGYPVTIIILGEEYLIYAIIFNLLFNIFFNVFAYLFLSDSSQSITKTLIDSCKLPPFFASIIGLFLFAFGYQFPQSVYSPLKMLADTATPLSLITLGVLLSNINMKNAFKKPMRYILLIFRQIIIPVLFYYILVYLNIPYEISITISLVIAMSIANSLSLYAIKFNADVDSISELTLLSVVILPFTITLFMILVN